MEWTTVADTTDGVIGIIGFVGLFMLLCLCVMWLSCFYILYTWRGSHRILGGHAKKINSFITTPTTAGFAYN
jgi:hypothetical protein